MGAMRRRTSRSQWSGEVADLIPTKHTKYTKGVERRISVFVWFVSFVVLLAAAAGLAQQVPVGHATDFVSSTYFEPPNDQQVKLKLSGAEALPLPGGLQDIRQLKIETFEGVEERLLAFLRGLEV